MNRRRFTALGVVAAMVASVLFWGGCSWGKRGKPQTDRELKGMGYVVTYGLAPDASQKHSINGMTDAGNQIISGGLRAGGGGASHFGGGTNMSFPRWVRVTWREPSFIKPGEIEWTKGEIIGDYHVEVLSRIPAEVFEYAFAKRGRAVRLKFLIKDDGVLFGWDVQESSEDNKRWVRKLPGGDFLDEYI